MLKKNEGSSRVGDQQVQRGRFLVSCYFEVDGIPAVLHCQLMARKVRVQYPGAIYHVMNRGDHREPIFRSDKDRELFLKALTKQGSS
jgi:hypothetical protein